ncbi:lipoprotein [Klebsiella variicola]|uniref:Lipoprotein n=1 Tax=Klebsiella variicola TaxID=244366 RepID=A0A7H4M8J3_KLEVA|nr:lipoprotein [Klebsiella variicola]
MSRMYDGKEEVIAAEYMPMVLQFGLAEEYDRLQVTRLLPFLGFWPEENLALQLSVESLIRPRFQRWLRDALMQCEKSQRQRIIFELAEADVCQYIGRLQPVMRLVNAPGRSGGGRSGGTNPGGNQLDQAAGCGVDQTASWAGAQH